MTSATETTDLLRAASRAADTTGPLWPLERFVAVNPLLGRLEQGFAPALDEARHWLGLRAYPGLERTERRPGALESTRGRDAAAVADELVTTWLVRLVGARDQAHGTLVAWRDMASADPALRRLVGRERCRSLAELLPEQPEDALLASLRRLEVPSARWEDELRTQLARTPGWSGYALWSDRWAASDDPAPRLGLIDLLAIKVATDAVVASVWTESAPTPPAVPPSTEGALLRLEGVEAAYRTDLVGRLRRRPAAPDGPPAAQVVCCIDARSEGLRRHLEAQGPYETIGFAGFFGVPARVRPLGSAEAHASAPVLLSPTLELVETPHDPAGLGPLRARRGATDAASAAGHGPAAYGWAEASGWVEGVVGLARTVEPRLRAGSSLPATRVDVSAFTIQEQAGLVETALSTMGLNRPLAPFVVLCGHGATTTANPHAAALDCGACAGNRGGANARALAAMANDDGVRSILAGRGREIPPGTWFLAAEHDTTTDAVAVLDPDAVPPDRWPELARLVVDLARAGAALAAERAGDLGPAGRRSAPRSGKRRAFDWSEVRPEWGLARNAAFIVAPRSSTAGVDLQRRAFLHSYDPDADAEGLALETILTAPMVVAHWINMQYYCSTVDPEVLGAGDKAVHNPVGSIGVLAGGQGDLRVGLPWQSVGRGAEPYHEPLRLLTVVEAPGERVAAVIARNPILQHLFDGAWVHLVVHEPADDTWSRRLPGGEMIPLPPEETT